MSDYMTKQQTPPSEGASFQSTTTIPSMVITIILVVMALAVIVPLLLPFFFVFKTRIDYNYNQWGLPKKWVFDNFTAAWQALRIDEGFKNTVIVCLGAIACTVIPSAMAGYVFSRYKSKITEVLFYVVLAGFFVPFQMVLIPLYRMSAALKLTNTLPGLFLPLSVFGISFWTMIYRSFFRSLPEELAEAARMDGAGHTKTFFSIMLPLAGPATVLAVLLVFMGAWNDYLMSLIMLSKNSLFTMQLKVAGYMSAYGVNHMPKYSAAAIIAAAPTVILYIIGHRWILKGTLAGALKG